MAAARPTAVPASPASCSWRSSALGLGRALDLQITAARQPGAVAYDRYQQRAIAKALQTVVAHVGRVEVGAACVPHRQVLKVEGQVAGEEQLGAAAGDQERLRQVAVPALL